MNDPGSLRPRKQPRQQRSVFMVEMILAAAARVLAEYGMEGFNTNRVAEVAGISVGSLYQYFPNKQAITVALIEHAQGELAKEIEGVVAQSTGQILHEGLRRLVQTAIAYQFASPRLAMVLDYEEQRLPVEDTLALARRTVRAHLDRFLDMHRATIRVANRGIAADDLLTIARAMIDAAAQRQESDLQALEERLLKVLVGYLA